MAYIPMEQALQQIAKNQTPTSGETSTRQHSSLPEIAKEEANYIAASQSERISSCTVPKVGEVLSAGLLKLGLKASNIDPLILATATQEIIKHNGFLKIKELVLAFDMAAREQLDFNPQTFQNFSILYLNQLINAYKRWAVQTAQLVEPHLNRLQHQIEYSPYIYSKDEYGKIRKDIQYGLVNVRKGILCSPSFIPYEWYNVMALDGCIPPDIDTPPNKKYRDLTEEEKENLSKSRQYVFDFLVNYKEEALYVW